MIEVKGFYRKICILYIVFGFIFNEKMRFELELEKFINVKLRVGCIL